MVHRVYRHLIWKSGFDYTDIVRCDRDSFLFIFQFLPFYVAFQVVIYGTDLRFWFLFHIATFKEVRILARYIQSSDANPNPKQGLSTVYHVHHPKHPLCDGFDRIFSNKKTSSSVRRYWKRRVIQRKVGRTARGWTFEVGFFISIDEGVEVL